MLLVSRMLLLLLPSIRSAQAAHTTATSTSLTR
jgi:hypothetical protein